jgi:hypothetical protein
MLVVRKGGGRNINNDRYLYLNVDDSPAPIPELRRLPDMNLGMLYQEKAGRLVSGGKTREARDAAAKVAQYIPTANAHVTLGVMDYNLGDKAAAASASAPSWKTRNSSSNCSPRTERPRRGIGADWLDFAFDLSFH